MAQSDFDSNYCTTGSVPMCPDLWVILKFCRILWGSLDLHLNHSPFADGNTECVSHHCDGRRKVRCHRIRSTVRSADADARRLQPKNDEIARPSVRRHVRSRHRRVDLHRPLAFSHKSVSTARRAGNRSGSLFSLGVFGTVLAAVRSVLCEPRHCRLV